MAQEVNVMVGGEAGQWACSPLVTCLRGLWRGRDTMSSLTRTTNRGYGGGNNLFRVRASQSTVAALA